jgi:hypothetical protein
VSHVFTLVPAKPHFQTVCIGCNGSLFSSVDRIYADLLGEAFKAYYCTRCKNTRDVINAGLAGTAQRI